jgi:hypothetical protein
MLPINTEVTGKGFAGASPREFVKTDTGLLISERVLERWEEWPKFWKNIDPRIIIDLKNHKITQWENGYDWPIVMPKRHQLSALLSWNLKLDLFSGETKENYIAIDPTGICDMTPYRPVFCALPNMECSIEHPNTSSKAFRDLGLTGTTFTEYNVLDMFVYISTNGQHIDSASVCLCTNSISARGLAVVVEWENQPKLEGWAHDQKYHDTSGRKTI